MKKLVFIFIILSFTSCIAQKNLKMEQEIIIPEITKEFETFDIKEFNTKKLNEEVRKKEDDKLIILLDYSNGYSKSVYYDKSAFSVVNNYYLNGNIEIKGVRFNNGSEYGTWYHYDEKGNLTEEENIDEGYDFGWLDVIKYCHKKDIQLEKGYPKRGGIKTEIYKNEEEGKKVWTISYYKPKTDEYIEVTLDGKTGKEIKRRDLEFIGN